MGQRTRILVALAMAWALAFPAPVEAGPGAPQVPVSADQAERSATLRDDPAGQAAALLASNGSMQAKLDRLRARVAVAEKQARTARRAAQQAMRFAGTMEQRSNAATRAADQAHADLEQYAVRAYMQGGIDPALQLLVSGQDAVTTLTAAGYLEHVAGSYDSALARSEEASRQAQDAAQQAHNARLHAAAMQANANAQLEAIRALLGEVEARLGSISGQGGPQTIIGPEGCPEQAPEGTLREGAQDIGLAELCARSVAQAATPQAALAVKDILGKLGSPYACQGVGRLEQRTFDCSSLVARAYFDGAGVPVAGANWAPSTRSMVPWDGFSLDRHYAYVDPAYVVPGDLALYDTGGDDYRHVVMVLADGYMVHTNACGDVAHVTRFWGYPRGNATPMFLVARRVLVEAGYQPQPFDPAVAGLPKRPAGAGKPSTPAVPGTTSPSTPPPTAPTPTAPTPTAPTPTAPTPTAPVAPAPSASPDPGPAGPTQDPPGTQPSEPAPG